MKRKGITRIEVLSIAVCLLLLVMVLMPGLYRSHAMAFRLMCQTNLKGLGRAMEIYAEDSEGRYPRAGGAGATWSPNGALPNWAAFYAGVPNEAAAFGYTLDDDGQIDTPGRATITSSWYLLIRYYNLLPKQFVCKADRGVSEFKLHNYVWDMSSSHPGTLQDVFDFGMGGRSRRGGIHPWPGQVVSYAYHMPYSDGPFGPSYELTAYSSPASPVAADRNPYLDINAGAVDSNSNSDVHERLGQNVLYKDGSVRFETSPKVGIGGDNIYTYGGNPVSGGGDPNGTGSGSNGNPYAIPVGNNDALLVSERNSSSP